MKEADTGSTAWFVSRYCLHDDAVRQQAKKRLDVVITNMNPNSILFLWWLNKNNPNHMKAIASTGYWSMWASGLLGRSLVAYYAGPPETGALCRRLKPAYSGNRDWVRLREPTSPWQALQATPGRATARSPRS